MAKRKVNRSALAARIAWAMGRDVPLVLELDDGSHVQGLVNRMRNDQQRHRENAARKPRERKATLFISVDGRAGEVDLARIVDVRRAVTD